MVAVAQSVANINDAECASAQMDTLLLVRLLYAYSILLVSELHTSTVAVTTLR